MLEGLYSGYCFKKMTVAHLQMQFPTERGSFSQNREFYRQRSKTCIWQALGSNLSQNTGYTDSVSLSKCWNGIPIRPESLPSASFPIHQSPHKLHSPH
jgi:hypothetical protein